MKRISGSCEREVSSVGTTVAVFLVDPETVSCLIDEPYLACLCWTGKLLVI